MTIIPGFLVESAQRGGLRNSRLAHVSNHLGEIDVAWPTHAAIASASRARPVQTHWPVSQAGKLRPSMRVGSYSDDLYHRVHILPARLDLGNISSSTTRDVWVWNAHVSGAQVVTNIEEVDTDGITISGDLTTPLTFYPNQERRYEVTIGTDGPPSIDAQIIWHFPAEDPRVIVTGNRIVAWVWEPDWTTGIDESLEWRTSILESLNGGEQRVAMRSAPRRAFGFDFGAERGNQRYLEVAATGWSARVWLLPVWPDGQVLQASVAAGTTEIPVDTAGRDYAAGVLAIMIGVDPRENEMAEVIEVLPDRIRVKHPIVQDWHAGSAVYPGRTARASGGIRFSRFTGRMVYGRAEFDVVEPSDGPAATGLPMYRGAPVFEVEPTWRDDPTVEHDRKKTVHDTGIALPAVYDAGEVPFIRQSNRWTAVGRAQLAALRAFLYLMEGRRGIVWMPAWAHDIELVAASSAGGSSIDMAWMGYHLYLNTIPGRRDVRIVRGGNVQYARITSSSELDQDTERLVLDQALAFDVDPADTTVQFLTLMRLDTDRVEWAWWNGDLGGDEAAAEVAIPVRTYRNDV